MPVYNIIYYNKPHIKKWKKKKNERKKNIKRFNQYIYQYNFGWTQCDEKLNSF